MQAISFSFENTAVRTLGSPESPLFVATDVASVLGYSNVRKAVYTHVDEDDRIKAEIDTEGGVQTVNCVNESGLYALIFSSKLESAKRFKKWVTSEVLPAIRRTGRYECPLAPEYITPEQGYLIQSEVQRRVHRDGVNFQTVYRALKARFKVPKYTFIRTKDFDEAIRFIRTCELRVPTQARPTSLPQSIPEDCLILSGNDAERIVHFIYYWRYLFRPQLEMILKLLRTVNSPMAARFWEAIHELHLPLLEESLRRQGYDIKGLKCYKKLSIEH